MPAVRESYLKLLLLRNDLYLRPVTLKLDDILILRIVSSLDYLQY